MLDYIAGSLELIGLWKVGNKNRWGFAYNLLCNLCWIAFVLKSSVAYGILLVVIPAMIVNIRNFLRWKKNGKKS